MIAGAGAILLLLIISCPILIFCIVICKQRQKKRGKLDYLCNLNGDSTKVFRIWLYF